MRTFAWDVRRQCKAFGAVFKIVSFMSWAFSTPTRVKPNIWSTYKTISSRIRMYRMQMAVYYSHSGDYDVAKQHARSIKGLGHV